MSLYFAKVLFMSKDTNDIWNNPTNLQLTDALLSIKEPALMRNFLRDVMTEKEIAEIGARLEAARLLSEGVRYTDITRTTRLSSRTVARISEWLQDGCDGYEAVLKNISAVHHDHIPPARAE